MAADVDVIVVGAGVIGLAVARAAALAGLSVLVLEQADTAGSETSARNSEVIHAGIYYPPGTLKARLCVEGRRLLYDFCAERGIAARRIGKLIVAASHAEEGKLRAIADIAAANGVDDLQWLSASDVAAMEPEVRCTAGLFSPSTGIVDSHAYMLSLQGEAEANGASFAFRSRFMAALRQDELFIVNVNSGDGEITEVSCNHLVNCAGHGAHGVASAIDGLDASRLPPRFLAKGSYCSVSGRAPFRHLVYPVPVSGALGIHATLDQTGAVRFGPDITWVDTLDYTLSDDVAGRFQNAVAAYWPGVMGRTLEPSYCGIRPKIHGPGTAFADFCVETEAQHGIPGLVNLFGIESPGLTASLALANHVAERLT